MAQILALGVKWPPHPGWRGRLFGLQIDDAIAARFEAGKHILSDKTLKKRRKEEQRLLQAMGFDTPPVVVSHPSPKCVRKAAAKARKKAAKATALQIKLLNHPKPKPVVAKPSFESSDEFLSSYEWRKVRMQALRKYGARCQCCGASPADGAVMNVDHIKPRKLFPHLALDLDNLQILCHECNHGKGNWDQTDWRQDEIEPEVKAFLRDIAKNG
jgi:5-methylcytosine-specific restriction endonuclease McrA